MHRRRHWGIGLMSLLVLAALAWCFWQPSAETRSVLEPDVAGEFASPAPLVIATRSLPPEERPTAQDVSPDGVSIRPAGAAEVNAVGMLPHPITPQHRRIFRENNLIGDLNGAMDIADVPGLRKLLQQYRDEYPEDAHVLQDGYELIANCLDRPSAETRSAAQRYYDEELASGLRRYIRRHCLEAPTP